MKKTLLLPLLALLLACGPTESNLSSESSESEITSSSSESRTPVEVELNDATYDFYCLNDFHGSIRELTEEHAVGMGKLFSELKRLKDADPEHTFILSSGDMFQGSLESNREYGMSVLSGMNEAGFDAMAVGNHEFDYGQSRLFDLAKAADFPFLGANIVKWENGQETSEPLSDLIGSSTIIERGGNRIGIIGAIGEGLTDDITSSAVSNCVFTDIEPIIKEEATRLREYEGCGLVILLLHDDERAVKYFDEDDPVENYVDGIFTGHTHSKNLSLLGGRVPVVQSYYNGHNISHFTLTVENGEIRCDEYEVMNTSYDWEVEPEIQAVIDEYLDDEFEAYASRVGGVLDNQMSRTEVANLGCKAIYEEYVDDYPDLAFAIENSQRASLYPGEVTYSDLYKASPFMNSICILNVTGSDVISGIAGNCSYTDKGLTMDDIVYDEYYTVAVIDYLALHQNSRKEYDYFRSLNDEGSVIATYETYPMDLSFDYMQNELGGVIRASDFQSGRNGFGSR